MSFDAYTVAIELIRALRPVVAALAKHDRDLTRQLRKAASSVPLNLMEGNKRAGGDRTHHFRIAEGSANELRAALDVARAWGYVEEAALEEARSLLDRELAMLWRLTHPRG